MFGLNAIYAGFAFSMHNTARFPEGTLIAIEECLLTIWFASQLVLFYDYYEGGQISSTWVWIWVIVIFLCYIICNLIELILVFFAISCRETGKSSKSVKFSYYQDDREGGNTNRESYRGTPSQLYASGGRNTGKNSSLGSYQPQPGRGSTQMARGNTKPISKGKTAGKVNF